MQIALEVKWSKSDEWKEWDGPLPSLINIDYHDETWRCPNTLPIYDVVMPELFYPPSITVDGAHVWDYRVNGEQLFRERSALNDRCE